MPNLTFPLYAFTKSFLCILLAVFNILPINVFVFLSRMLIRFYVLTNLSFRYFISFLHIFRKSVNGDITRFL